MLDLLCSKLHMYNFHYNHMKVKYPHADQLRLLFTGTDSLAYAVSTNNIYRDMDVDAATKYDFSEHVFTECDVHQTGKLLVSIKTN